MRIPRLHPIRFYRMLVFQRRLIGRNLSRSGLLRLLLFQRVSRRVVERRGLVYFTTLLWAWRSFRQLTGKQPEVVSLERLPPGEGVTVLALGPRGKLLKADKRAARAAREASGGS